jgi:ANTAR domain-containing protein
VTGTQEIGVLVSIGNANGSSASIGPAADDVSLGPEELWDRHGTSLYAMACALLGDESAALRAVTLGMMDLYRQPELDARLRADEALRSAARCIYRRADAEVPDDSIRWSMTATPVMTRLGEVALSQRRTLALCVFGGHTYREAAATLDTPPGTVARLLISGLLELTRMKSTGQDAEPSRPGVYTIDRAHALLEEATEILMRSHGLGENYAVELLCHRAADSGRTVVDTAAQVIAEAPGADDGHRRSAE